MGKDLKYQKYHDIFNVFDIFENIAILSNFVKHI